MKSLKHPATVIAALALFVALGSGAWASGLISGSHIKNHSIAAKKLTQGAVSQAAARVVRSVAVCALGGAEAGGATGGPGGKRLVASSAAPYNSDGTFDAAGSSGVRQELSRMRGRRSYCLLRLITEERVSTI